MTSNKELYTYRNGSKLKLRKRPDQFVVRRLPKELTDDTMSDNEQVSSASTRVKCKSAQLEPLMTESRNLAPTHHAYETENSGEEFLITDRVIITFTQPMGAEKIGIFAGRYALEFVHKFSDDKFMFRLTNATGMNPIKLVVKLTEKDQEVKNAEHDLNQRMQTLVALPTDPSYGRQWHLHQHLQHTEYDGRASVNCEQAWQLLDSYGSADVVVALADDGCQLDHPDFNSPGKFAGWGYFEGHNLVQRGDVGADAGKMYQAGSNHGTSCAGVIAAETDGKKTVGAAPGCRLLPIKWQSIGSSLFISDAKLLIAFDYIADKADVMSNSWGASPDMSWSGDVLERIAGLAKNGGRRGKGIIFLWAAGNENCPIQHQTDVGTPYTNGWQQVAGSWVWQGVKTAKNFSHNLVGIPGLMHIAALTSTAQRSHYSNYGTGIDIAAPSSNSHAYFRMPLTGLGITTATGAGSQVTGSFGGTSSATPLVAGIIALIISANPQLSALEIVSLVKQTASKNLNMTGYPQTPAASYDPEPTWDVSPIAPFEQGDFINNDHPDGTWSPWFGFGKIDAFAAVEKARQLAGNNNKRVRVENRDEIAIPDADPAGIVSQIFVAENSRIRNIKATVEIEHTFIGDLIVRLVAPDGQRVDLHRRSGGSEKNLSRTFDESTTPALADFYGRKVRGAWKLEVSDHGLVDTGRLKCWVLEAEIINDGALYVESAPGLRIPDNDPAGITDTITITEDIIIADLSVEVDITHPWIGDLRVELKNSSSASVALHSREGRYADDIQHIYRIEDEPELAIFFGQTAKDDWELKVSDHQGRDVGKLNRWALIIR